MLSISLVKFQAQNLMRKISDKEEHEDTWVKEWHTRRVNLHQEKDSSGSCIGPLYLKIRARMQVVELVLISAVAFDLVFLGIVLFFLVPVLLDLIMH